MDVIQLLLLAAIAGIVPAVIAGGKGRSPIAWWAYGTLLLPVALAHSLVLGNGAADPLGDRYEPPRPDARRTKAEDDSAEPESDSWDSAFANLVRDPGRAERSREPQGVRIQRTHAAVAGAVALLAIGVAAALYEGTALRLWQSMEEAGNHLHDDLADGTGDPRTATADATPVPSGGERAAGDAPETPDPGLEPPASVAPGSPPAAGPETPSIAADTSSSPPAAPAPSSAAPPASGTSASPGVLAPDPHDVAGGTSEDEALPAAPEAPAGIRASPDTSSPDTSSRAGERVASTPARPPETADPESRAEEVPEPTAPKPESATGPRERAQAAREPAGVDEGTERGRTAPSRPATTTQPQVRSDAKPPADSAAPRPAREADTPGRYSRSDTVTAVGDLVAWLQTELARRGYYRGSINGRAGETTRDAIRAYQRSRQMRPSGRIDHALIVSLRRKERPSDSRESGRPMGVQSSRNDDGPPFSDEQP